MFDGFRTGSDDKAGSSRKWPRYPLVSFRWKRWAKHDNSIGNSSNNSSDINKHITNKEHTNNSNEL